MINHFMDFRMMGNGRVSCLNPMSSTCENNKGVGCDYMGMERLKW